MYYPLWLIYAAAVCQKNGFDVEFLDAPATPLNNDQSMDFICKHGEETKLFVFETSTPSSYSDVKFIEQVKKKYPDAVTLLVGTNPSALPEETLGLSTSIDAICRHEFDYIVRDVAKSIRDVYMIQ